MSTEQRKYNRLPKSYFIEYKEFKYPTGHQDFLKSNLMDISAGGVCVECVRSFPAGTKLQLRVHVPRLNKFMPGFFKYYENDQEQYINAIGEVAWVDSSRGRTLMGVKFLDLDPDVVTGIQGLIRDAVREARKKAELAESNKKLMENA